MKCLLQTTSAIEAGAGLALLCCPAAAAALLLGSPLDAPAAVVVARLGGAGLLALGIACWFARGDTTGRAAKGLIAAMTLYNVAAVAILAVAGLRFRPPGPVLWLAVVLHAAMAAWCLAGLVHQSSAHSIESARRTQ